MKVERFIKEYANYIKKQENTNAKYIDKIVNLYASGFLTIPDTMQALTTYVKEYRFFPESFIYKAAGNNANFKQV